MRYKLPLSLKPYASFPLGAGCSMRRAGGCVTAAESARRRAAAETAPTGGARRVLATLLTLLFVAILVACGTQSRKMAGEGAVTGAAVGAVGGMVSALVFGGDVGDAAARGAVWGGSTGAAAGAIAGARVDSAQKQAQQEAELQRLKAELGEDGFKGLEALVDCKHEVAIAYARTATRSNNKNHSLAGLWIELLAFGDQGKSGQTRAMLPDLVAKAPDIGSEPQAEQTLQKSLQRLQEIRAEYNLPRTCS